MSHHWALHTPEVLHTYRTNMTVVFMVGPSDLWWEPVHRLLWIKKCACEESPGNNVSSLIGCSATPRHTCAWIGLLLFFLPVSHWLLAHRRLPAIICPCTFQWILHVLSGFFFFFFWRGGLIIWIRASRRGRHPGWAAAHQMMAFLPAETAAAAPLLPGPCPSEIR